MRERLEELNWRTQPQSLNHGDHGDLVEISNSEPGAVAESSPDSMGQQQKNIA